MNQATYTQITDCLEAAAKALERAQEIAAQAKERALAGSIAGVSGVLGDVIDELNETSIAD